MVGSSRPQGVSAGNAVAIVEAGYSLDGSDTEWLGRVLGAAKGDLEHGHGCYAFTCKVGRDNLELTPAYVERDLDPNFAEVVAGLNRTAPREFFDLLARSAVLSGSLRQNASDGLLAHFDQFGQPRGIRDSFSLFAQDGEGWGLNVTAPASSVLRVAPRARGVWKRVGVHLASAMRLRRKLQSAQGTCDALLSPEGPVAHAEGELRSDRPAREVLVGAVRAIERARTARYRSDPERAFELWQGLVRGTWSLVDHWESDGRRYVAAYRNLPQHADPRGLSRTESLVLRYVVLAASNKEIAFTLGLTEASVESAVRKLLRKLRCRRSDLLLFADPAKADTLQLELDGATLGVLSVRKAADERLLARLSASEREIALAAAAGQTNVQIARSRGSSTHTVANQMKSIFEKLGVGSRWQLARALTSRRS